MEYLYRNFYLDKMTYFDLLNRCILENPIFRNFELCKISDENVCQTMKFLLVCPIGQGQGGEHGEWCDDV